MRPGEFFLLRSLRKAASARRPGKGLSSGEPPGLQWQYRSRKAKASNTGEGGMMEYGYARVSTREQNVERQLLALREFGLTERQIVVDRQSGKDFDRPGYCRLLRRLKQGDTLVIKSIDRLGRNYGEILEQWRSITREKGAEIVVLDMPLLDTRKSRDLAGTQIADIVLQLLSYVAQTERELIRQRQAEGIAAAKLRGVKLGRPEKARPENFEEVRRQWAQGELSARAAGRLLQVSHRTFLSWARQTQEK